MTVDSLQVYTNTLEALPKVEVWAANFAKWVADRTIDAELEESAEADFTFEYGQSSLKTELELLGINPSLSDAISDFSDAWETGLNASVLTTLTAVGFGSITKTEFDLATVTAGKAKIQELENSPPTPTSESKFPEKFRDATLGLTVTITGTTPGGDPKVLAGVAVI